MEKNLGPKHVKHVIKSIILKFKSSLIWSEAKLSGPRVESSSTDLEIRYKVVRGEGVGGSER